VPLRSKTNSKFLKREDEDRCPKSFKNVLEQRILRTVPNRLKKMSLETIRRWKISQGLKSTKQSKGYYTDGRNRPDVNEHRVKFLAEMVSYENRMMKYAGADMTEEEPPVLSEGEKGSCSLHMTNHHFIAIRENIYFGWKMVKT
jgi:hypothetical protein